MRTGNEYGASREIDGLRDTLAHSVKFLLPYTDNVQRDQNRFVFSVGYGQRMGFQRVVYFFSDSGFVISANIAAKRRGDVDSSKSSFQHKLISCPV